MPFLKPVFPENPPLDCGAQPCPTVGWLELSARAAPHRHCPAALQDQSLDTYTWDTKIWHLRVVDGVWVDTGRQLEWRQRVNLFPFPFSLYSLIFITWSLWILINICRSFENFGKTSKFKFVQKLVLWQEIPPSNTRCKQMLYFIMSLNGPKRLTTPEKENWVMKMLQIYMDVSPSDNLEAQLFYRKADNMYSQISRCPCY